MKKIIKARIIKNQEIAPDIFEMVLLSKELAAEGFPGKFVNLYLKDGKHLLPRPISICEVNSQQETVRLIYGILGEGTRKLSTIMKNQEINVLGPLGNGFTLEKGMDKNIIIGGGIGVPPLLELIKQLKGSTDVYLGFRCNPILVEDFKKYSENVYIATEDGSEGHKGNVIQLLKLQNQQGNMIYSCGPKPMLMAVSEWAQENTIDAELSLEERMACGIGACLVCTCKTGDKDKEDWQYKRVCKDGPVFSKDEVIWE